MHRGRSSNFRQGYGGRGRNYSGDGRGRGHNAGGGHWNDRGRCGRERRGRGGAGPGGGGGFNHVHNIGISGNPSSTSFAVAVQGCSHGELDSIYEALESYRHCGGRIGRDEGHRDDDVDGLVVDTEISRNNDTPERNKNNNMVDVLLCCGDVQTLRNAQDFHSLAVPPKYKSMGDFHAYYSGQKIAPILTIMIGGNHEASNYLQELHYGGWVAPNIYYLGAAGVVNLCKKRIEENGNVVVSVLRIAGISGIYKDNHYSLGRYEMPPYDNNSLRSVYHTREVDVKRMRSLSSAVSSSTSSSLSASLSPSPGRILDIMITHDWPRGIAQHGNLTQLLQQKPFFRQEVEQNEFGSPAHEDLLYTLKPRYWFAAHLHVKFEALVRHDINGGEDEMLQTTDAATAKDATSDLENSEGPTTTTTTTKSVVDGTLTTEFVGMETNDGICPTPGNSNVETLTDQMTRFLSLDKCLPKRRHIQISHVEPSSSRAMENFVCSNNNDLWLEYDATWLALLQRTHGWTKRTRHRVVVPDNDIVITKADEEDVLMRFKLRRDENKGESLATTPLTIPPNFVMIAPPFDPTVGNRTYGPPPSMIGNPQTDRLLNILGMDHQITVPCVTGALFQSPSVTLRQPTCASPQLIPVAVMYHNRPMNTNIRALDDKNEIDLDDDGGGEHQESDCLEQKQMKTGSEGTMRPDTTHDPEEIELNESEDEGDAAGDSVCFVPQTGSNAKKPRMNS